MRINVCLVTANHLPRSSCSRSPASHNGAVVWRVYCTVEIVVCVCLCVCDVFVCVCVRV